MDLISATPTKNSSFAAYLTHSTVYAKQKGQSRRKTVENIKIGNVRGPRDENKGE